MFKDTTKKNSYVSWPRRFRIWPNPSIHLSVKWRFKNCLTNAVFWATQPSCCKNRLMSRFGNKVFGNGGKIFSKIWKYTSWLKCFSMKYELAIRWKKIPHQTVIFWWRKLLLLITSLGISKPSDDLRVGIKSRFSV